jgi:hypothetical protein
MILNWQEGLGGRIMSISVVMFRERIDIGSQDVGCVI